MTDQATVQSGAAQNQSKYKIKVEGQEKEVDLHELLELAQKGDDYTRKTQALAEKERSLKAQEESVAALRNVLSDMEANPDLKEVMNKVYTDMKSGKISKSDLVKDRHLNKLDKLIDESTDASEREKLKDIRQIILEETGATGLREEVVALRNKVSFLENNVAFGQNDRADSMIKSLKGEYTEELVNKYAADIRSAAIKSPGLDPEKILWHFATKDEVKSGILSQVEKEKKSEIERKQRGSTAAMTSTLGAVEAPRDKQGRVSWSGVIRNLREAGHFK